MSRAPLGNKRSRGLPDMDKQLKLVKILWAIDIIKKLYQKLLQKTDEFVKSQFIGLSKGWFYSIIAQINGGMRYGKISL